MPATETKELVFKKNPPYTDPETSDNDPLWDNDLLWIEGWHNLIDNPSPEGKIYYASTREPNSWNNYNSESDEKHGLKGIWLYDGGTSSYHYRVFRKSDLDLMELCGVAFAQRLQEDGSLHELIGKKCRQFKDRFTVEQINALPDEIKKKSLETAFKFYKKFYGTPRYDNKQRLLWSDMKKDHAERLGELFAGYPEVYVQLFLRRIARILGIGIGNYAGD